MVAAGCLSLIGLALVLVRRIPPRANGIDAPEAGVGGLAERPHPVVDRV
jgi:hypothetical protein